MEQDETIYRQIGDRLAQVLLERLDNEPSSSDLNVIRQFLKDQGVYGLQLHQGKIHNLLDKMPFEPELESKIRKPRSDSA